MTGAAPWSPGKSTSASSWDLSAASLLGYPVLPMQLWVVALLLFTLSVGACAESSMTMIMARWAEGEYWPRESERLPCI